MILLRSWGVRIIIYINDMLVLTETSNQAYQHLETLLWILQSLGFVINREMSVFTASQKIEFLGLVINSQSTELREKLRQIKGEATKLLSQQLVTARALSQFIGKLNAAAQAVTPAPLFYCHLQGNLKTTLPLATRVTRARHLSPRGTDLVATTSRVERQVSAQGSRPNGHILGCLPTGVGSIMQRCTD